MPTRDAFDRELGALRDGFVRLGNLVEDAVRRGIDAFHTHDPSLADTVIEADNVIDALHLELEQRCMGLMATQQPMAKDLRTIAAVWAMTIDLERIGDHAEDIARKVHRISPEPLLYPLVDIPGMADIVRKMLRQGLDAFVASDVGLAERTAAADHDVDHLYSGMFRTLNTYVIENPRTFERATHLLMAAQAVERMGDYATNIAERVVYMVTGTLKVLNV
ncbi:MAG TPA: phosphate signaling complex protein PhoU [bacterium]|nr:phosphate signaling complex protein PhoU [bacterium]